MRPRDEAEALEEALNVMAGQEPRSARDRLEKFPADNALRPLIEVFAAARSGMAASPSPEARARHLVTLMEAAAGTAPQVVWGPERKRRRRFILRPLIALGAITAFALAPTMAFASNAQPGDPLYRAKLAIESARLALETDPAGDVSLHLELASVRLSELSRLLAAGSTGEIGGVMANLEAHRNAAARGIDDLRAAGSPTSALEIELDTALTHHVDVLTALSEKAGCDPDDPEAGAPQCKGLLNAIENSSKVLGKNPHSSGDPSEAPGQSGEAPGRSGEVPGTGGEGSGKPSETPGRPGGPPSG